MQHMELRAGRAQDIAIAHGRVDLGALRRAHAQPRGLQIHHVLQLVVVFVHVDRRAGGYVQLVRAADVVDVRVRDHDGFHVQAVARHDALDLLQVVARIDHQGVAGLLVAENGAVALQHAHRQDLMHHK